MAAKTLKTQIVRYDKFYLNPENLRETVNFNLPEMISKIVAMGGIIQPIFALPPEAEGENKGLRKIQEGNRRQKALSIIADRAKMITENRVEDLRISIAAIEGLHGSQAAKEAAETFDYGAITLDLPFIEISKEQAANTVEMLKLQIITGTSAKALTPKEYAKGVLELLAENDGSEEKTASDLGNTKPWIQKITRLYSPEGTNFDPLLVAAIEENRVDVDLADQIAAAAKKFNMATPVLLDAIKEEAKTRGKTKATRMDLDNVKKTISDRLAVEAAANNPEVIAEPLEDLGSSDGNIEDTTPKDLTTTPKPRSENISIIDEAIRYLTKQAETRFTHYEDTHLAKIAIKAEALHNMLINSEKPKAVAPAPPLQESSDGSEMEVRELQPAVS